MIKIIAGALKGRNIEVADGTRPTSNKVREAIFDIFGARRDLEGARVLDLFAGSGAIGFEAISRGASNVEFVEANPKTRVMLEAAATKLGVREKVVVHGGPAPRASEFDLVVADPPYKDDVPAFDKGLLSDGGFLIFETDRREAPELPGFSHINSYRYGKPVLHLYERSDEA